jgi:predicted ATPase
MRLLERSAAMEQLGGHLREAAAGHGRLLFIGGEAGIGKTALIQHFCDVSRHKARVFMGACDPLSTPRPLDPLLDIGPLMGGDLEHLLNQGAERERIFHAFFSRLAGRSQVSLVVFEDVQWADEATLDLLRFLGRRVESSPCLLVATYRDDEVDARHPLRVVIGDLATAAAVRRMRLAPLSEDAVRILAARTRHDPVQLHRKTGGNPFFVTETLASQADEVPPTVRDAVLARAARLSAGPHATLNAAAVIGTRINPTLLREVADHRLEAVEECVSVGMLVPHGQFFAFRHELAREAILDTIPLSQRMLLHRRALDAMRRSPPNPDDLADLAHHAEGAGDRQAVLEYAPAAARRAAELEAV